ncbi:Uncharacterized protein SCF082_LOCUS32318, partial [Durusdinium trenchii]
MGDHSQLNAFIAAALEYKTQQRKQDQHRKSCPELYKKQPVLWIDDPTVTQGPETLDSAVERSESFPSLDYGTTDEWYGRSTSQSFSLSDAGTDELADSLILTSLQTIDNTAQGSADQALTDAEQQALLLLTLNNLATEDGSLAQDLAEEQLTQTLLLAEQNAADAFAAQTGELVSLSKLASQAVASSASPLDGSSRWTMRALLLLPAILLFSSPGVADDAALAQLLGPRPEIADYQQRDDFVRDVLAWERRRAELLDQKANGTLPAPDQDKQPHDWHHVTGPEDLDTALRNAEGYEQPHYQQTYRFERTTHISFPLKSLPSEQLANKRVEAEAGIGDRVSALVGDLTGQPEPDAALEVLRPEPISPPSITRQQVET